MATLKFSFIFSITFLLLFHSTGSTNLDCQKRYCGGPETVQIPFEFPFLLRESNNDITNNESIRCGYPGFDVLCNEKNQALLTLSTAGEFVITYTSIEKHRIWINDPNKCLPRRFLENIDLNNSAPFQLDYPYYYSNTENITFFNCTQIAGNANHMFDDLPVIPCLSSDEYLISYALQTLSNFKDPPPSCREIGFASIPVRDGSREFSVIMDGLYSDIVLRWDTPQCNCQVDQFCGFLTDSGSDVTCYNRYNPELPGGYLPTPRHKNLYFFPIVCGISGVLFFIWVILSVCKCKQEPQHHQQSQQSQANIEATNRESPWYVLGLSQSRIEQYPKIQLAESGTLPKSIDNVCSICLNEYKPMETLRSMPQCAHYFHVDCIDVWLKMNATCPLCRNLPEGSALVICSLPPPPTILHQPPSS